MSTDQRSIDWYNNNAEAYATHVRDEDDSVFHHLYEKPAIYSLLPNLKGKKIISLGCGPGEDCIYLKTHGAESVTGIDISENLIKIAKKTYPELEFKVMDMEKMDFEDGSFDLAFSSLALHYTKDWEPVFNEVYRLLKPGSNFIFSCDHPVYNSMQTAENNEDTKIQQLARIKHKKTDKIEVVGDYLSISKSEDRSDFGVTCWHKPIGKMSEEIKKAGFVIDEILEPLPLEKMKTISPSNYETLSKIPYFIIFKLLKPLS